VCGGERFGEKLDLRDQGKVTASLRKDRVSNLEERIDFSYSRTERVLSQDMSKRKVGPKGTDGHQKTSWRNCRILHDKKGGNRKAKEVDYV